MKKIRNCLLIILICLMGMFLFIGGKTLKVKADETYNFANITEEESLEFLAEHNIAIPGILNNNGHLKGVIAQGIIKTIYNDPTVKFSINYDKMLNFANDIKQAVLPYLNEQNLTTQSCAPYFLKYSTVKNANGEWVAQGGAWDDKWLNYNCYAFAIGRNEQPAFYQTGGQYQPGNITTGSFYLTDTTEAFAKIVKNDLEAIGYKNVSLSTTIPEITNNQSLICVRRGLLDYHFMKYDLATGSWYHKPADTAILKYNGVPNNSDVWYAEQSKNGVESKQCYGLIQLTYDSDIYFIKYDRNVANISSLTSSASCNLNVNTGKDSILEIKSTVNNKYFEFTTTAENSFEALLFDKNMDLLTTYTGENMRFLKFYKLLSNDTYYLKFNFKNVSDSGSILTTISAHNHQLAYQNNSSNHRETCSVCGYDEVVSHAYTKSYTRYNSAQHTAYCACGASKLTAHNYTARYSEGTTDSTHIAYCVCGATMSENHRYTWMYERIDGLKHWGYCVCGARQTSGHYISNGAKPPYMCMYCRGQADMGYTQMDIIPIGAVYITANGTYVLPNGIVIVAEADLNDFLNQTPKLLQDNLVVA